MRSRKPNPPLPCQQWVPAAIDVHFCTKAPRKIGYELRERGKQGKPGKLIERFPATEGEP